MIPVDDGAQETTGSRRRSFEVTIAKHIGSSTLSLLLSPFAPLLKTETIIEACRALLESEEEVLKPVRKEKHQFLEGDIQPLNEVLVHRSGESHWMESNAFTLAKRTAFDGDPNKGVSVFPWEVGEDVFEISTRRDWWVCEKLVKRKRIIFRVVGNNQVGMGHIYRALSLAHEITDHEVLFVSDTDNSVAVKELAGYDYWLGLYSPSEVIVKITELKPDLVVNDSLDTTKEELMTLKKSGIRVLNFEDLGTGAIYADLTINELYDEPKFEGGNICWGREYFFVRDEFSSAKPHKLRNKVDAILLAFGGTDQHDLSRKIHHAIRPLCKKHGVDIHIVTGPGYRGYKELSKAVSADDSVFLTHATGVISGIMEKTQLAITSNGRTVYELAHMNIPSIVISQHDRERTHAFACEKNGVIPLGLYQDGITEEKVVRELDRLLFDLNYREKLFHRISEFEFGANKQRVLGLMRGLLDND